MMICTICTIVAQKKPVPAGKQEQAEVKEKKFPHEAKCVEESKIRSALQVCAASG